MEDPSVGLSDISHSVGAFRFAELGGAARLATMLHPMLDRLRLKRRVVRLELTESGDIDAFSAELGCRDVRKLPRQAHS